MRIVESPVSPRSRKVSMDSESTQGQEDVDQEFAPLEKESSSEFRKRTTN